jgi:uncharacterized protein (TIGR00251 family)
MSDKNVIIAVKVQPNAPKNEIIGLRNDYWRIKIAAPPEKGKANNKLIQFLSEILVLKKDNLSIFKGSTNSKKLISIHGLTHEEIINLFNSKC